MKFEIKMYVDSGTWLSEETDEDQVLQLMNGLRKAEELVFEGGLLIDIEHVISVEEV